MKNLPSESNHVEELLSLWQRAVAEGQAPCPEELCRHQPELAGELRKRIDILEQINRLAKAIHVEPTTMKMPSAPGLPGPASTPITTVAPLPELPGYEVLALVDQGAMGVVYRARDRQLGRNVAIKRLLHCRFPSAQRERFLEEAKAIARLNHPHIVQMFSFGEHRDQPYLVMELVQGTSLKHHIQGRSQPLRAAAQLMVLLARAVQAAHDAGIIHRDLKPGNILMAPPLSDAALNSAWGCPKIADFGLAWRMDREEVAARIQEIAGTASYMAPEQAQARVEEIGPGTDIYALGAILYELMVGRPPFRGRSSSAILWQVVHEVPAPPRQLRAEIPRDLETICRKCLHKEIAERYPTAQAVAEDLRRFLHGEPIQARPVGQLERATKWMRRKPIVATLLGGIAISLLVTMVALGLSSRRGQQAQEQQYLRLIQHAQRHLDDGKPAWARPNLEECAPRLRQWEWFHLAQRHRHPGAVIHRDHAEHVPAVAASPRKPWFASADAAGNILLWKSAQGPPIPTLFGHVGGVTRLAVAPASDHLVSGGADGFVVVCDVAQGKIVNRFEGAGGPIFGLAVHPLLPLVGLSTIRGDQDHDVVLWNWQTQTTQRLAGHTDRISSLAFSPDGQWLASASHDRSVRVWQIGSGQVMLTFRAHRLPVGCVAFSPDGLTLVSSAGLLEGKGPSEDEVLAWSLNGTVLQSMRGHSGRIVSLAFANGKRLFSAGWDKQIKLWNLDSGQEVLTLKGHEDLVLDLAVTPQGTLISGSADGTVRIWQAPLDITLGP